MPDEPGYKYRAFISKLNRQTCKAIESAGARRYVPLFRLKPEATRTHKPMWLPPLGGRRKAS